MKITTVKTAVLLFAFGLFTTCQMMAQDQDNSVSTVNRHPLMSFLPIWTKMKMVNFQKKR